MPPSFLWFEYLSLLHLYHEDVALDYSRLQLADRRQRYYALAEQYSTLKLSNQHLYHSHVHLRHIFAHGLQLGK